MRAMLVAALMVGGLVGIAAPGVAPHEVVCDRNAPALAVPVAAGLLGPTDAGEHGPVYEITSTQTRTYSLRGGPGFIWAQVWYEAPGQGCIPICNMNFEAGVSDNTCTIGASTHWIVVSWGSAGISPVPYQAFVLAGL